MKQHFNECMKLFMVLQETELKVAGCERKNEEKNGWENSFELKPAEINLQFSLRARQLAGARKVKAFHVCFGLISPLKSFSSSPVNLSSRAHCCK